MLKNILKHFYRFFLYSFAFVVLTSAILITVIRITLPGIGGYRQQTQDWISQYMSYPVEISIIDANWNSWSPNLQLHQVSILDPVSNEHILEFDSVQISIDIIKSLIDNQITPKTIAVSDLSLTLIRRLDGSITASKYSPDDFSEKGVNNDAIAKWFLVQKNILVRDAQITLLDLDDDAAPVLLSNATLRIRNNDYRTQIEGSAILPETHGDILTFALDAYGDVMTPDWSGEMYFGGKDINISPLFSKIEDLDIENHEGTGDVQIWSTWNRAKLRKLEGLIELHELKLADNQSEVYINQIAGNFSAIRRNDKGVEVILDLKKLVTPNGEWPETVLTLKKIYIDEHNKYRYFANASYLNLDDINPFLHVFSDFSEELYPSHNFDFTGILLDSVIKYDPTLDSSENIYIDTEFKQLGGKFKDHPFKLDRFYGQLQGTLKEGNININSSSAQLEPGKFLNDSMTFYELNAELNWQYKNNNLILSTELLDTHTQDFDLRLKGNLKFDNEKNLPFIDLMVELSNADADVIAKYLPSTSPEKVRRWFKRSLVTGEIPSAEFVFRGQPEDYPFRNNEGVFQGYAEVNLETLDYSPKWPPADMIDAGVRVRGDTVTVDVQSGYFYDAEITKATAVVKNLANRDAKKSIALNIHINGEVKDGLLFIKDSPLQTNPTLMNLPSRKFTGGMGIDLDLGIPLYPSERSVDGSVTLRDASYTRTDIGIELTEMNGKIDFTKGSSSADRIKAILFDYPVELSMENKDGLPSKSTLSGTADNQFISGQLIRYFPSLAPYKSEIEKRINGSCLWEVSSINTDPKTSLKINEQFVITSSLTGLSIDLPAPLAKSDEAAPFKLSLRYPEINKREIYIYYANILNGLIHASNTNGKKSVITSLSFGDTATIDNENNKFSITGKVDNLIAGEWISFISDISGIEKAKDKNKSIALGLQVDSLELGRHDFSDVDLKIENFDAGYHFNFTAEDINGDAYLKLSDESNSLKINLQTLNLAKNTSDNIYMKHEIDPVSIPLLDVEISEFTYDDYHLGRLLLTSSKTSNGLTVDKININKTDMEIDGSGIWNLINNEHHSRFNLTLNAASMKTMLETFNDDSPIKDGQTKLELDAHWQGTPMDFSLNKLNGTLLMDIDKGRFIEINPSAGRLFGLLSLQTLPRRLTLDFSDLFGKGLAFDHIEGRFNLENGDAYTNNLAMTGPSVNINISGRTGLVQQDYDQIATVTPRVTDSLPVASALFGPIGIGVGAVIFLASEIFQSIPDKIDTLLRKQYTITGAWDDPQVTKIKRNEEKKEKG